MLELSPVPLPLWSPQEYHLWDLCGDRRGSEARILAARGAIKTGLNIFKPVRQKMWRRFEELM